MIDPYCFKVNYDCGKHHKNIDIIKYIKNSGISKDDKEKCFKCQLTYEKIKEDEENKILYKCYCGKNICKKCKQAHLDENKENKKAHNMIDFKYKDYKCCCSNKGKNYNSFCLTCNKNLCQICNENHKGHEKKIFGELPNLTKKKKDKLIEEIKKQKEKIDKFNEIIDDWYKSVKVIIDEYKIKLELYNQINFNIINRYNSNTNYYEEIKNTEYLRIDFDDNFNNLINSENNFQKRNSIIFNLINDSEKKKTLSKKNEEKKYKEIKIRDTNLLKGCVNHLCEIKKDGTLIVGINNINNNKDELYLFKQIEDSNNIKKFVPQFSKEEDIKILSLKELKNGYLLIINEKQFEVREVKIKQNSLETIQNEELEEQDERFINIIELINGNLVSISYTISDKFKNYITFWKKNIMSGSYETVKEFKFEKEKRPIEILEMNEKNFVVLYENNDLYCYNSNNGNETELIKIENKFPLKKMIKIQKDGILFIFSKYFILFSLSSLQVKTFPIEHNITDICYISNSNNFFLETISDKNNQEFLLLNIDLIKYQKKELKYIRCNDFEVHNQKINCIIQLSNGNIVTGSDDKKIKIWEILPSY